MFQNHLRFVPVIAVGLLSGCAGGEANNIEPFAGGMPEEMGMEENGITYACPDGTTLTALYDPLGSEVRVMGMSKPYQLRLTDQEGGTYTYDGPTNGEMVTFVTENGDTATLEINGEGHGTCVAPYHTMAAQGG